MFLTRFGIREWGGCGLIALVLLMGCILLGKYVHPVVGVIPGVIIVTAYCALAYFFRSPYRTPPDNPDFIVSPADGEVRDISVVDDFEQKPFEGKALRIGIFLSVLNVHVNRSPAAFRVITKEYRPGKYLDARSNECAKENEAMTIAGYARIREDEFPMAVRQISGAIARRIVCQAEPGSKLSRGKVYGMIKFGSRTELYLPHDERFELLVKPGDKVKAGITVFAKFNSKNSGLNELDERFFPAPDKVAGPGSRWDVPGNRKAGAGKADEVKPGTTAAEKVENKNA